MLRRQQIARHLMGLHKSSCPRERICRSCSTAGSPLATRNPASRLYLETTFPVVVNDRIVIPVGSYVQGEITEAKRAPKGKGGAEIRIHLTTLIMPNGYSVKFDAIPTNADTGGGEYASKEGQINKDRDKGADAGTVIKTTGAGAGIGAIAGGARGRGNWRRYRSRRRPRGSADDARTGSRNCRVAAAWISCWIGLFTWIQRRLTLPTRAARRRCPAPPAVRRQEASPFNRVLEILRCADAQSAFICGRISCRPDCPRPSSLDRESPSLATFSVSANRSGSKISQSIETRFSTIHSRTSFAVMGVSRMPLR